MSNYILALITAVQNDQGSISEQQMTDAKTTEMAAQVETNLYNSWQAQYDTDHDWISYYASGRHADSGKLQEWENQYNVDSAEGQSEESRQDGVVQGSQQQTSADASNLQMKAQMVQSVNGILSTVSGMIGNITA